MKRFIGWSSAVAFAALLSVPSTAFALRCDGRFIQIGDDIDHVQALCGPPSSVRSHQETRSAYGGYASRQVGYYTGATVSVQIDELNYDFGPSRFRELLVFENGVLRNEIERGYGTAAGARARRAAMEAPSTAYVREDD